MKRRAATLLAAAAACSALLPLAYAQTWLNPNSGSWSIAGNWVGGVVPFPSASTQLTFNASGAQSYTAFNDIADPFTLNALRFNASSTGPIQIAGGGLRFDGATAGITQSGNGLARISSALTFPSTGTADLFPIAADHLELAGRLLSSLAPTSSTGAYPNFTGSATLSGGANLLAIATRSGDLTITGGEYNLSSTLRRNDFLGNVNNGPWSLSIGEADGATANLTQTGGAIHAPQGFINAAGGSGNRGTWTITGSNTLADFAFGVNSSSTGRFGILSGEGTINVTNGAKLQGRLFEAGRYDPGFAAKIHIRIDGPGSQIIANQLILPRWQGDATLAVTNGGQLNLTPLGTAQGLLRMPGDDIEDFFFSSSSVVVSGPGSIVHCAQLQAAYEGAVATISVSNGGQFECSGNSYLGIHGAIFPDRGSATLLVSGSGSSYSTGSMLVLGGDLSGQIGGHSLVQVTDAGLIQVQSLVVAADPQSTATVSIAGAGSRLTSTGIGAGTGDWIVGREAQSVGALNVADHATASLAGSLLTAIAGDTGGSASAMVNVDDASLTIGGQLQVSGQQGVAGGTSTILITNAGVISSGGDAFLYLGGTLSVGSGTALATFRSNGRLSVDGRVNYNSGTLVSSGILSVGGAVLLSSAGADRSNKKTLEIGAASLTVSGLIDLNDNDMLVHSDQKAYLTEQIRQARNGGTWDHLGVTSTAARENANHNTTLGVLLGGEFKLMNGATATFDGRVVADSDTLVKYTYYGDTDFNGRVNFDDYVRIDNGFNNHLAGWMNGDFDENGLVNFDDFVLIDLAFNTQGQTLTRAMRQTDDLEPQRALVSCISRADALPVRAVPEPTAVALAACALANATCRRGSTRSRRREPAGHVRR
jgi:hypothetical protein